MIVDYPITSTLHKTLILIIVFLRSEAIDSAREIKIGVCGAVRRWGRGVCRVMTEESEHTQAFL